jgi:hypothetical protein
MEAFIPYEHDRCSLAKFSGHFSPVFPCFAMRVSGSYYYMSLMAESGCLEQVDRGADNPTSFYKTIMKPVREAKARSGL